MRALDEPRRRVRVQNAAVAGGGGWTGPRPPKSNEESRKRRTNVTNPPPEPPHVRIAMLSQPRYLAGVRATISSVAERLGFAPFDAGQIALAVDEAICNVIHHGYERQPNGRIWISIWPMENGGPCGIRILLEDEGHEVDPATIQPRPLNEIRPGGLGVHIIRKIMDMAEYSQRPEGGMRLLLEKRLERQSASAGEAAEPYEGKGKGRPAREDD